VSVCCAGNEIEVSILLISYVRLSCEAIGVETRIPRLQSWECQAPVRVRRICGTAAPIEIVRVVIRGYHGIGLLRSGGLR